MPRYCAVKLCKNRGGVLSKDNKRISFYPFPLRDQARLQKWVDNMKRQEWTPSRHQYLCSEHFTEDSFDLRWGIRYLKHTAIPTIFPYICDDENNRIQSKKNSKVRGRTCSTTSIQLIRSLSPPRKKPLILKDNDFNNNNSISNNNDDSSLTSQTTVEVKAGDGQVFSVVFRGQLKVETTVCPQEEVKSQIGPHLKQTDVPSQVCVTSSEPSSGGLTVDCSDAPVESDAQEPVCAFPHDPSATATSAAAVVLELGEDSSQTGRAGHNSIAITPIVCLQVGDEQERGEPRETEAEGSLDKDEVETEVEVEGEGDGEGDGEGEGEGEHAYLCEHSYSRQDLDHEQLWSRIAALHAKITELDQREEETLAKIQAAEGELTQLRKQNIVCEEKQKALEEYFTSVFLQ